MNIYLKKFIADKFAKPGKALDLGAGDFFDVACLKQLGWGCEGVDKKIGVDLEKFYLSKKRPFDLVYSNYLLHKLKNKKELFRTAFENLKNNGWFFLHTFDKSDKQGGTNLTVAVVRRWLQKQGFRNISARVFSFYDNEEEHKHWHKILEITARK